MQLPWDIPLLIITPLTFLGGSFYSINMLPPFVLPER
jgi:ABC-type multidrug transport system permease subunit